MSRFKQKDTKLVNKMATAAVSTTKTTFTDIPTVTFQRQNTLCWGVEPDKFKPERYSIPVVLNEREKTKLAKLCEEHGAKNSRLYGDTLYLTCKALSDKQQAELMFQGRQNVMVHFDVSSVVSTDEGKFLVFRCTS